MRRCVKRRQTPRLLRTGGAVSIAVLSALEQLAATRALKDHPVQQDLQLHHPIGFPKAGLKPSRSWTKVGFKRSRFGAHALSEQRELRFTRAPLNTCCVP